MRVKEEGVFRMHSEDRDELLPIVFIQRRHEHPPIESSNLAVIKNWRLRERVSILLRNKFLTNLTFLFFY